MSPTAAMLSRNLDLSGCGGAGGLAGGLGSGVSAGGGAGAGAGSGCGGAVTQAASCNTATSAVIRASLVTEPDSHDINIGRPQPAARYIEFTEVFNGANVNAVIVAIVYPGTLDPRFNAV